MSCEKDLTELFADPVLRDYLELTDRAIRLAVSRISADCELLADNGAENGCAADIMNMCCRLVQVSELYGMLTREPEREGRGAEATELCSYIRSFADGCSELLTGTCSFRTETSGSVYIEAARDILTYLLLAFVRRSVLRGASEIAVSVSENEEKAHLTLAVTTRAELRYAHFDDFQNLHFESVSATLCKKIGAVCELTDNSFTVILPEADVAGEAGFSSPVTDYEPETFSPFKIMLGDLCDRDDL